MAKEQLAQKRKRQKHTPMGSGSLRISFTPEQERRIQAVARDLYETKYKTHEKPQESFATDLGCTQPHISDLINGRTSLSLKRAETLAKLAGFPDLQTMIGPFSTDKRADGSTASPVPPPTRFHNLNTCLLYHGADNWPAWVVAVAAHGYFGQDDVQPAEWADRLNSLNTYLGGFEWKK